MIDIETFVSNILHNNVLMPEDVDCEKLAKEKLFYPETLNDIEEFIRIVGVMNLLKKTKFVWLAPDHFFFVVEPDLFYETIDYFRDYLGLKIDEKTKQSVNLMILKESENGMREVQFGTYNEKEFIELCDRSKAETLKKKDWRLSYI